LPLSIIPFEESDYLICYPVVYFFDEIYGIVVKVKWSQRNPLLNFESLASLIDCYDECMHINNEDYFYGD